MNQFGEDTTVVTLAILQNPSVKHWLGGIEPVWTLLDESSFAALTRLVHRRLGVSLNSRA